MPNIDVYNGPAQDPFNYIGFIQRHDLGFKAFNTGGKILPGVFANENDAADAIWSDCLGVKFRSNGGGSPCTTDPDEWLEPQSPPQRAKTNGSDPHPGNEPYPSSKTNGRTSPRPASDIDTRTVTVTFFPNKSAQSQRRDVLTLPQLAEQIQLENGPSKLELPWLKLVTFGDTRSRKGCLRTNANAEAITGIEVEHDKGEIAFDTAIAVLRECGLRALLYTSPSYVPAVKERWRVLLPTSNNLPPETREKFVARVNGLFGGKLAPESFVLSQAYLYGCVNDNPAHRVEVVDGGFIDLRDDLDSGALGKNPTGRGAKEGVTPGEALRGPAAPGRSDAEIDSLLELSRKEGEWHIAMLKATASMVGRGWTDDQIYQACAPYCWEGEGDADVEEMVEGARAKWNIPNDPLAERLARLPAELRNMLRLVGDQPVGDYKTRKHLLWAFIHTARRKGIDENEIVGACLDEIYCGCAIYEHVRDNGGEDYIKQQIEQAINSDPLIDEQQRSIIRVEDGKLDEQWRAVMRELIKRGCPVYVRGNRLVQPLWRWEKADNGREVLTARFEPYNVHRLADMVAHHACKFQKFDARKKGWKDIDPPDRLIERIIEAKNWEFSTIVGIINAPTMRADRSLLTTEGYDPATQLWFKSSGDVKLPPIADKPGKEDAQRALALLNELLTEFPFDNAVARSAALAGIMTPVLRGALSGAVPLFAIIATEPRSGKTYLVELIAVIATGHIPVPTSIGSENTEEMEKRIETAGLSGRPIMHLNNLPNGMVVESVALAQLSTEGAISIRKLGKHEEGLCDCRATTAYLNGNNIVIAEDLVPRTASCQLNARLERPESRTFARNPINRVRADRGRYLGAVFTIARAFMAAGTPRQPHKIVTGFEQWSALVQQSLIWLGEQDPFGGMDELRALDPKHEELQALQDALKKHFPADTPFTVADCQQKAEETLAGGYGQRWEFINPDLRAVMVDAHGQINAKAFGRKLMRHRNRIHDGWYIEVVTDSKKARVSVFKIKKATAGAGATDPLGEPIMG